MDVEAWVRHVFDHEREGGVPWYHRVEDVPDHSPAEAVALLTALMREPVRYLAPYSDHQIAEGIWFLVEPGSSNYARALLDRTVDRQARLDCIRAIPKFFADLLAVRCLPELSRGSAAESNPLNTACYMWWDMFPTWGTSRSEVDEALLAAMDGILSLPSPVCQESALHGLGHWHASYPERVERIVERYLLRAAPTGTLAAYARAAMRGCVA